MDQEKREILDRFEARIEGIAVEIADASLAEIDSFGAMRDAKLWDEVRDLSRRHLEQFVHTARTGNPPSEEVLAAARERAVARARQMVPLPALLQSYMIAQRIISAAITRDAAPDARSRGAALDLMARTFDYNIVMTAAMAEAYVEVVQGDLSDLTSARSALLDAALSNGSDGWPELTRRAVGLGFDPQQSYVVTLATLDPPTDPADIAGNRAAAQAIARASGRPERNAFVVSRDRVLVALLDARGPNGADQVLCRAATTLSSGTRTLCWLALARPSPA